MSTQLMGSILDSSILVGGIIALLLVLRPLLHKKYGVKWWYLIWLIMAIRLVIPFGGNVKVAIGIPFKESFNRRVMLGQQEINQSKEHDQSVNI